MPKIISNKSNVDLDYPVVRPSLDLDFTQEELDPRITFSRGSIGTRVNRNRLIETVAANQPRFDYDPVTGECKGLLIEESRQNLLTNSDDTNSYHSITNASVLTNQVIAPDGTLTGDALVSTITGGNNSCHVQKLATISANTSTYVMSVFLKAGNTTQSLINLQLAGGTYQQSTAIINWSTNTISSSSTATMVSYPNGWYRVSLTLTNNGTNTGVYPRVYVKSQGTNNVLNEYVYIWGWQCEVASFPTSYIPTSGSTVTRSAELADMTGTNFSSWYNQNEGTIYTNNIIPYTPNPNVSLYFLIFGINAGNRISIEQTTTNQLNCFVSSSNTTQGFLLSSTILPENINRKTSLSYSSSNNQTLISKTSNQLYTFAQKFRVDIYKSMTTLYIGRFSNTLFFLNGTIARFTYYPKKLKDNQLLYLTQ